MSAFGFTDNSREAIPLDNVVLALTPEAMWEFARFAVLAAAEMDRLGKDFDQIQFRHISTMWQECWPDVRVVRANSH